MGSGNLEKDQYLLEKRFIELSRNAYQRDFITYSDFLNLNEQNILHTLPKENLFTQILTFGGYGMAERQMAAFIPDALYLRCGKNGARSCFDKISFQSSSGPSVKPKIFQKISHIETIWDQFLIWVLTGQKPETFLLKIIQRFYLHMMILYRFLCSELTRIRHTSVKTEELPSFDIQYTPKYEELTGTVASVRLDSLLSLAFFIFPGQNLAD